MGAGSSFLSSREIRYSQGGSMLALGRFLKG
jgi:hypothetical protein